MSKLNTRLKKPYVDSIEIIHEIDECPDLSFLEQDYFNDNPKYPLCSQQDNEKYKKQDKERLESYNNNEWYMMGIFAKAIIHVPFNSKYSNYYVQIVPIKSAGIWGIESDNDDSYIKNEELQQISDVKILLKKFHVRIPKNIEVINKN